MSLYGLSEQTQFEENPSRGIGHKIAKALTFMSDLDPEPAQWWDWKILQGI
jgi:hypothetical protein